MNLLLLTSHSIAEYDDLRMFSDLGYNVFSIGAYTTPASPTDDKRPALPNAPYHATLARWSDEVRASHGDPGFRIDWAKAHLHPEVIDWADVIIVHHFPEVWIGQQWDRIKHKRVIWRTCGQSDPRVERAMSEWRAQGLEIVRYSPAERRYFEPLGAFAGEDAVIRFGKYPADYGPWTGELAAVINITQNMAQRGDACGYPFWQEATRGLARWSPDGPDGPWAIPLGPGSEEIGGPGALTYPEMLGWLARARVYLYTGTKPASYTLGLMEAMLTGIPVVSIGKDAFGCGDLFEGDELCEVEPGDPVYTPETIRIAIDLAIRFPDLAAIVGHMQRAKAIELFGVETIGAQWVDLLGQP